MKLQAKVIAEKVLVYLIMLFGKNDLFGQLKHDKK